MRLAATLAVLVALLAGLTLAPADRAAAIPSAVVQYGPDLPASLDQYAAPGNVIIVIASQRNRNPARIRAWRAKGAIVLAYVNAVDYQAPLEPFQETLYGGNFPDAWIDYGRSSYPGTHLLKLGASSPVATYNGFTGQWGSYVAHWIKDNVIKDGSLFNGVFLDVWGERVWQVDGVGGPGSDWEAGVAKWGRELRALVGPNIFLIGNNTQYPVTAAPLNGRMWESFDPTGPGWNMLDGPNTGLIQSFNWDWTRPQLDILWRNEANPSDATKRMLNDAALRVTKTGTDIAVGSSDHGGGFPPPFGIGGGKWPPDSTVGPSSGPAGPSPTRPTRRSRGSRGRASVSTTFGRGRMGVWRHWVPAGGKIDAAAPGGISLAAGASPQAQAILRAGVRSSRRVTVTARIEITRAGLRRGADRLLLSISGARGARDVGIVRTARGLRWASWTTLASGARTHLALGRAVPVGRWLTVRLRVDWRAGLARDALAVGGRPALRVVAPRPAARATTVWLGAGRSRRGGGPISLLVRSVRVTTQP